jgi:DNA-binding transcriptional MocR family regulator
MSISDPAGAVQPGGLLAEHCRRHRLDVAKVRADLDRQRHLDALRCRTTRSPSTPDHREADNLLGETRDIRDQLARLRAELQRVRQIAIDAALDAVEAWLAAELPAAVRHLVATEGSRANGTP